MIAAHLYKFFHTLRNTSLNGDSVIRFCQSEHNPQYISPSENRRRDELSEYEFIGV